MMLTLLTFIFLGCSQTVKYVKKTCPKLVTFERDHNRTLLDEKIKLSVPFVDDNTTQTLLEMNAKKFHFLQVGKWGFVELEKLKNISLKMQHLKSIGKEDIKVLKLYENEIADYNNHGSSKL